MQRTVQGRRRRVSNLRARIASNDNDHFRTCTIIGCGKPTQRAAKSGLAIALCRKHQLHRQRHGSPFCPSPSATTLKPYLTAASLFIEAHRNDIFVKAALADLRDLLEFAGPVIIATRLRGLPPNQRAKVALARLREAEIKPERLLAITLAVHALIEDAPEACHRINEWTLVAVAKAAHRLASGFHRVWELPDDQGRIVQRRERHTYPRSSGRVLRHLGQMIEKKCKRVIDNHLAQVVVLKVARVKAQGDIS
jgi:hypothetical protein